MYECVQIMVPLITSPYFISLHMNLSSPNQEPRFIIEYRRNVTNVGYYLHRDNQTFDEVAMLDLPSRLRDDDDFRVIDCLNGLVCLHDSYANIIVLWNPALRKHLILPKPRVLPRSEDSEQTVGFGFVPSSHEYKIVSFISTPGSDSQVEIYEKSTGSWRDLNLGDYSNVNLHTQQAHFNGILHWHASSPRKVDPTVSDFIYSFDLENEKHGSLMVPSCWRDDDKAFFFVPSAIRESFCLIHESSKTVFEIWVLKEYGVADSWEKLFIIDGDKHSLIYFCSFRHDNSEMLFAKFCRSYTELVSYNGKNNQVKNVGIQSLHVLMLRASP